MSKPRQKMHGSMHVSGTYRWVKKKLWAAAAGRWHPLR
jgi:hypothetical protein